MNLAELEYGDMLAKGKDNRKSLELEEREADGKRS